MPKKFKGENTKAAAAKAKKDELRTAENARKQQEKEDEYWRDDDKHIAKKQQRKDDKEKKRLEQLERKKELQKLHDEEMETIKSKKPIPQKLTRALIANTVEQQRLEAAAAEKQKDASHLEIPLEENLNRLQIEGEARSVEAAISVLKDKEPEIDRHPEKRMKAAYKKYEEDNLPILKQENPGMKLSQLKQMLWKDWMKSPENPLNQKLAET